MIPKKIHYCWFGRNELPDLAKKCIDSWKKYCPDYEIIEWNEENFDINSCTYVREAYQAKKWAFVSDYARFWILYHEGGLYFDTDVELISSIDDIVTKGNFMGCEPITDIAPTLNVAPGLGLGACAGLKIYREMLDFYNQKNFIKEDGSFDMTTIVQHTSKILMEHGAVNKNELQKICDVYIYPAEYFCPMNYQTGEIKITENTVSIHHYSESWHSYSEKMIVKIERFFSKFNIRNCYLENTVILPFRVWRKIEAVGIKSTMKFVFNKFLNHRNKKEP